MIIKLIKRFIASVNAKYAKEPLEEPLEAKEEPEETYYLLTENKIQDNIDTLRSMTLPNLTYLETRSWKLFTNSVSLSDLIKTVIDTNEAIRLKKSNITLFLQRFSLEERELHAWLYEGNEKITLEALKRFLVKELHSLNNTLSESTYVEANKKRFCQIVLVDLNELINLLNEFSESH